VALQEIEFELSAYQQQLAGFPSIVQGQPLTVILDGGVLVPDVGAANWYAVTADTLPQRFVRTGPATFAFCGKIVEAELEKDGEGVQAIESAVLLVECAGVPLRVTCAAQSDGMLPFGTWETRTISGHAPIKGMLEDDFASGIGETIGVSAWGIKRLVLTPGDLHFGEWIESDRLLPSPIGYDRVLIAARMHRRTI
jgi:hypothetical protein